MRDDRQRLADIFEACRLIQLFTSGRGKTDLSTDQLLQSALLYQLQIIGEAANRLSESLKTKYAQIPWAAISAFRNRVAHEYFRLDLDLVWNTVESDVPKLLEQLAAIIKTEFPA